MKNIFLVLLAFFSCHLYAGKVVLKGQAKNFANKTIGVYHYTDFVTFREKKLISKPVSQNEIFEIEFDTDDILLIKLKIEDKTTTFYSEPGKVYQLDLSYSEDNNSSKVYNKELDVKFKYAQPTDLNELMIAFNIDYLTFIEEKSIYFLKQQIKSHIKDFEKEMIEKYKPFLQNEFFKTFLTYSLANLKDAANAGKKDLYDEFLANSKIFYNNYEYMNFFNQYFHHSFKELCLQKKSTELRKTINTSLDVPKIKNLIKEGNQKFKRDSLLELYLLFSLNEVIPDAYFDKQNLLNITNKIFENTSINYHRIIAYNIISKYTNVAENSAAPNFTLIDKNGEKKSLEAYSGKYVYLNFWASWSIPSLKELKLMQKLHKNYGEDIAFVSINCDADIKNMIEVQRKYNYDWDFLHLGENYEVLESYRAKIMPTYVFLDPNGKIMYSPAERPSGDVERQIYNIMSVLYPKKKFKIGQK